MKNNIILFGSIKCPACLAQVKVLHDYFNSKKLPLNILYYDLNTKKPPKFLLDSKGSYSMPTWYFSKNKKIIKKILSPSEFILLMGGRVNSFGNVIPGSISGSIPEIGTLAKNGRNFPNRKGFEINNSWNNELSDKWGNVLDSGTLGREFGPGKTDKVYSTNYFNNIRMAYPGGDLDTLLNTNRECNIVNNPVAATKTAGLLFDSKNPQIVSNFGIRNNTRKKNLNNFGNLYSQMGPAFERGNQYLVQKDTVKNLYGGATQGEPPRPNGIKNKNTFIGQAKEYTPLKPGNLLIPAYKNNFGKSIPKIGEGTVIVLKNNKIKYS